MSSPVCGKALPVPLIVSGVFFCLFILVRLVEHEWQSKWRDPTTAFIFPRSVFLSQRDFSISLKEVGFLRIPLPRAHDSFNDWSLSSWLWWKESEGVNKKKKGKGASRDVDNLSRSEWCVQAFVFSGEISGLRSHEGMCKVSGGLAGTDVLTQWTCTWLFAYSLKLKELTSPFGNK